MFCIWHKAMEYLSDSVSTTLEQTHVQHCLPGARGNPSGGGGGGDGPDDEDDRWDYIESIAGSILTHCDTDRYGVFVPNHIGTVASNVLADRYHDADHDDICEMLDWYDDNFDEHGEPIDDDDNDSLCSYCEKNQAAGDCCYNECGNCCDESDCERHGWD